MRAIALASKISVSSVASQFHKVLLLSVLVAASSLGAFAQITVSPASIKFTAKQLIDTVSSSKPVTISNTGASAQTISIVTSGDFSETDNCNNSIAGGGACTANISFAPTIVGSISGAVSIYDQDNNLLAFVGLTGTGEAPVSTAPASLSFTAGTIGTTSAAKTFKITNNTKGTVTINSITTNVTDYTITTGTCLTAALAPAKFCTVTVTVTPTSATDDGGIIITDNAPNALPTTVKLTSTATGGPTTPISLSKTSLTFKVLSGGTSATQTITLTNTSSSTLTLGTVTASSDYAIVNNNCTGTIAAGKTCTFGITFDPTFIGSIEGSAAVAYTGNNSPQLVNLSGTSEADLTVAPTKLTFASQSVGTSSTAKSIKITNNNTSASTLSSIVPSGDFQIQLSGTTCSLSGGTLAAGKTCTVEIQFAPTIAGAVTGALTVTNTSSPDPLLIGLSGTGVISASATLNPSSAHQGSSETVVITGNDTNFGPTTTVNFGSDITVGTVTVNGPTSASVPITIDDAAATGSRNVTITTGSQVITPSFTVIAGVPQVTVITPNTIQPTQTESVTVTGAFTNWASGTTKANFGPGIAVGGAAAGAFGPVTVNSATSLTASLVTSGATNGFRPVQIQTGSQTLTVNNGMYVETCNGTAPTVLHISPASAATGVPLNAQVQIQFSVPMSRSTFSLGNSGSTTIFFYDETTSKEIPGSIALDASGTIATITPSEQLPAGRQLVVYLSYENYVQDACGDDLPSQDYYFYTAFSNDLTGPALTATSPVNGDTNIALNGTASGGTPVVLQFSTPIDPITVQAGFSMAAGSTAVLGNFTYSANDETVTFTPVNPLTASTTYTVSYTTQITDDVGNALTNPGSFSFTTGTSADTTTPAVTLVDPPNGESGVGLNVTPTLTFNEPIDGATLPTALILYYEDSNLVVPVTVTVSANRLSVTMTPTAPLLPSTYYYISLCGYTDIAGNSGSCFASTFFTGNSAITNPLTVSTINPSSGQTGVPLNARISAQMSTFVDPTSISSSSITVTPSGGGAIAGTVSLAADGVTVIFTPSAALTASKTYNVSVSGFRDVNGNAVTTFASSFTTGTSSYGSGSFNLTATSPTNGATGVSVTSPVTFTMNNLIDAASVNPNTVYVYLSSNSEVVAGTYSVSGTAVTFTPLTQYPASTVMTMTVCNLLDEAGNTVCVSGGSFTTGSTVDQTAPTVTISPVNGAQNVGLNTQIVLSFSKSINASTITPNTLALFNGDTSIGYNYTISRDNRTIVMNYNGATLPPGATLTIELTSGIQDLSGNALANTSSQFTLTTELSNSAPSVTVMRPASGATNVPATTGVTLFTSAAMNPSTIAGAFNVTDNGVVVSGTLQTFSNGQAIQFTPGAAFGAGDIIQVSLTPAALSSDNVPLNNYQAQFTIAGSPTNTAATVQTVNPPNSSNAAPPPLNTIIQVEYNQALKASTLNNTSVTLYQYSTGTYLTPTISLVGTQVINIAPAANLVSGSQYQVYVSPNSAVTNIDGVAVQPFAYNFTAGTAVDNAGPTITSQAPTSNSTVGTNSAVAVNFNKTINPVSVTGSTIQLAAGATDEVPASIAFSPDYTRVSIIPQAPLPPSTQMTVTVSGVTSEAGKAVAKTTTNFTTEAGPDFIAPYVVTSSVLSSQANVPVNSVFSMTFSKPMDIGSNGGPTDVYLYNYGNGQYVTTTVSWSADQTTIFLVPTSVLYVGTTYQLGAYYMTDLAGNPQTDFAINFTTAFSTNTNPPTVINTSPENSETAVPVNAPVEILFSEPIQPTSIGGITVTASGNPVAVTPVFSDANQLLTLTPTLPLLASNANYTITITGVEDTAGNVMSGTVTNTFTTGPTFNLIHPTATVFDPLTGSTGVGINVAPRITFSERLNPLTVVTSSNETYNSGSVMLVNGATNQYVPATVSMTADRLTAILTPSSPLLPNTYYYLSIGCNKSYYDVAGNYGLCSEPTFVTGAGSDTSHATVSTISPASSQTGVPLNALIIAQMSDEIDPTTVTNSSITVTPSGGSAIAGTVALATDGITLTFTPSGALTASKVYNVSVGGFNDVQGNSVTTFPSSFTTGTSSYGSGSFTLVSSSPVNGATGVAVTSPVTFTMNNLIDAASVNPNTVYIYVSSNNDVVAGTYAVSGAAVTFTPLTQYPASTLMTMTVCNLRDEANNTACVSAGSFTTATTADHTAPTVTITPANGTTNAGLNTQAVLTFSKSINPATITQSSLNLFNGDLPLNPGWTISRDNRTVMLNASTLPAGATLTVAATNQITDLSGNALANTTSQFTTTTSVLNTAPTVVSGRPGNGATLVPTNTVITLFTSAPMNAGTLSGALYVSQNGVLVSGTTTVGSNGQSIEFTPSSALIAGTSVQVFLNSTAQDIYGNYLTYYSEQFTTAGSPTNTAAVEDAVNPFSGATNVPLNTIIQVEYDQALKGSTLNNTSVTLYQYSSNSYLTPTVSLVGTQVINIAPTGNLVSGSQYQVYISPNNAVTNTDGVAVQPFAYNFTAGTAVDTAAPTITTVAPPNSAANIGTNAFVAVDFNKAINPVSVTGSSIQLSGGSVTEVPSSIMFTSDYKRTIITPQAQLPSNTKMSIAISGVTSQAGVSVASQTTTFNTVTGADFVGPYVINPSVQSGQTVGTNAVFAVQFNEPIDPGSVNPGGVLTSVYVYDNSTGTYLTTTISFSADLTTIFLKPSANLTASQSYQLGCYNVTDLSGNLQQDFAVDFLSGTGTQTTGPSVAQISPPSAFTGVPLNAPVDILFSEAIDGASLGGVTLKQGGSVIPTTTSLFDGDQGVQLLPLTPLSASMTYTINVTGVLDITGNAQSAFSAVSFTTGTGVDLVAPTLVSTTPASGATNVPDNTTVQVVFSEAMDSGFFDPNTSFTLRDPSNNVVPSNITFSTDYKTATLQPKSNLAAATTYTMYVNYSGNYVYDLGLNRFPGTQFSFTTH